MSAGTGFNLSTKKEDVSTRLKTQNLKRAKHETKKLEEEGKKMEERLMELKMAMNREKEERERQGGGFWKKGQQGSLTTYADEVLAKKKNKSASGKGKIKILRDKPLDIPERSNQPGTMAYIAQRGALTPRDKPKGPKCGQCEERSAAVSCMQCSEDYCAGCFAAFHLKGNLKKHRSVPITATPRQCFASPRPNPSSTNSSYNFEHGDEAVAPYIPSSARKKDRNSPEGASGTYDNSLLHGSYNEAEQAASFQDALQAWRTGKSADSNSSNSAGTSRGGASHRGSRPSTDRPSTDRSERRGGVPYSPVQTPTVNVDSSTGMIDQQKDIEITFNTSSMTYAERLLLKKHRRTDIDKLFTPRDGEGDINGVTPRQTPRRRSGKGARREKSSMSLKVEEFYDGDFDDEERVDFHALYDAVKSTDNDGGRIVDPDTISIVEVQDNVPSDMSLDQAVTYKVQEEGEQEAWSTDQSQQESRRSQFDVKPPSSAKSSRHKSGRKSASRSSLESSALRQSDSARLKSSRVEEPDNKITERDSQVLGARLKDLENEVKRDSTKSASKSRSKFVPLSSTTQEDSINIVESSKPPSALSRKKSDFSKNTEASPNSRPESSKPRPDSAQSRPKSGKPRPQTGTRTQSRHGNQSRTASRQGSRPSSRANSRIGSSRATSRAETPGLLTKAPSEALKEIAQMTPTQDTYKGIDSLFMVGVQPVEQEERTLTPTQHKEKEEKIKVSYQLYNMAPRSWKPDASVIDAVPVDIVDQEVAEDERASSVMAYHAYSEQLVSDITERLISRFDELPVDDDSLSDQSSGGAHRSLGEEYRTWTPSHSHGSSVQNSPCVSARATPISMMRSQIRDPPSSRDPPSQTPRQAPLPSSNATPRHSARSRAQTPRLSKSRAEVQTPRKSHTFHGEPDRPVSRAIVMEGTDLSIFDTVGESDVRDADDEETLDQLEWELASQSGRVTAEGKISRMDMPEDFSDDSVNSSVESFRSRSRLGQDQGYDINSRLKREELEDEEDVDTDDESDVRNLM